MIFSVLCAFALLHTSGATMIYIRIYANLGDTLPKAEVITTEGYFNAGDPHVYVGTGAQVCRSLWEGKERMNQEYIVQLLNSLESNSTDPNVVNPNYVLAIANPAQGMTGVDIFDEILRFEGLEWTTLIPTNDVQVVGNELRIKAHGSHAMKTTIESCPEFNKNEFSRVGDGIDLFLTIEEHDQYFEKFSNIATRFERFYTISIPHANPNHNRIVANMNTVGFLLINPNSDRAGDDFGWWEIFQEKILACVNGNTLLTIKIKDKRKRLVRFSLRGSHEKIQGYVTLHDVLMRMVVPIDFITVDENFNNAYTVTLPVETFKNDMIIELDDNGDSDDDEGEGTGSEGEGYGSEGEGHGSEREGHGSEGEGYRRDIEMDDGHQSVGVSKETHHDEPRFGNYRIQVHPSSSATVFVLSYTSILQPLENTPNL